MGRIYHSYSNETGEFSDEGRDGPNLFAALALLVLAIIVGAVLAAPWWVRAL